MGNRTCTIDGCDNRHCSRGWCQKHYRRWKTHGTTDKPPKPSDEDRFWAKVGARDDCWHWIATLNNLGYPQFWNGKKLVLAHRWSYEHHVGPIPDGLVIDHLCRTPACVNPEHLEPVTQRENILRGEAPAAHYAKRTHCNNGHPFDHENTWFNKTRNERVCKACRRERRRQS